MHRTAHLILSASISLATSCDLFSSIEAPGEADLDLGTDAGIYADASPTDAAGPAPACVEGEASECPEGDICFAGGCEQICKFGAPPRVTQEILSPTFVACAGDTVCVPSLEQNDNRFGACVAPDVADARRRGAGCESAATEPTYCNQLLGDSDAVCEDDLCILPCASDSDCSNDELCISGADDAGNQETEGACVPLLCGDTPDPDATCAQFFNLLDAPHPGGDEEAPFTRNDAYCLSKQCYIRVQGEAEVACVDTSACGDEQVCVDETYCMDTCESDDDCDELACAYTLPADEDISSDTDDISAYVCVDYGLINFGQIADPIASCESLRDAEFGPASWDRGTGECVYGSRSFSGTVRYAFIQDTTFECLFNDEGDLPGVEDPGADVSFIGLSNTSGNPLTQSLFEDVYATARVVKVFRDGTSGNDLPGYGHLDGQRLDGESRFSSTNGCPSASPAPNNTIALGCGGGVFVEFSPNGSPGQVVNLDSEGGNKYVVVSEYDSTCDTSGIDAGNVSVFEQYQVFYCDAGVDAEDLTPANCATPLVDVVTAMQVGQGPAAFSF